ncbi:hypothetical protein QBZ16_000258 [Prototheca wickerhamii]|uniref:Uncharacterized protein n=1 Tax=Prototheca wickerhamii TaxID=3111 RepID=A0AAD9INV6_PROWI|nr:hypothetical protein QBZ16_000258 [Prototheca wickerhamii]
MRLEACRVSSGGPVLRAAGHGGLVFEYRATEESGWTPPACAASLVLGVVGRPGTLSAGRAEPLLGDLSRAARPWRSGHTPARYLGWGKHLAAQAPQAWTLAVQQGLAAAQRVHEATDGRVEALCRPAAPPVQRYLLSKRRLFSLDDIAALRFLRSLRASRAAPSARTSKWDLARYEWSSHAVRRLRALALDPRDPALLCLLAKQWTDLSLLLPREADAHAQRVRVNSQAVAIAERALALAPDCVPAFVVLGMACGRLAGGAPAQAEDDEDGEQAAEKTTKKKSSPHLGEARQRAALPGARTARPARRCGWDAACDAAHHMQGRLLEQLAALGGPAICALGAMGVRLPRGSVQGALAALRRAVELAPGRAAHRAELGRILAERRADEEAARQLRRALACAVEDINDWQAQADARRALQRLERRRERGDARPGPVDQLLRHPLIARWAASFPQAMEILARWQALVDGLAQRVHQQLPVAKLQALFPAPSFQLAGAPSRKAD